MVMNYHLVNGSLISEPMSDRFTLITNGRAIMITGRLVNKRLLTPCAGLVSGTIGSVDKGINVPRHATSAGNFGLVVKNTYQYSLTCGRQITGIVRYTSDPVINSVMTRERVIVTIDLGLGHYNDYRRLYVITVIRTWLSNVAINFNVMLAVGRRYLNDGGDELTCHATIRDSVTISANPRLSVRQFTHYGEVRVTLFVRVVSGA